MLVMLTTVPGFPLAPHDAHLDDLGTGAFVRSPDFNLSRGDPRLTEAEQDCGACDVHPVHFSPAPST